MSKIIILTMSVITLLAQSAWSQGVAPSAPSAVAVVTTTTLPSVTNTTLQTIQTSGQQASGNNGIGTMIGVGVAAFCGYKAVTAWGAYYSSCGIHGCNGSLLREALLYTAGTVVAGAVVGQMSKAKDTSDATVNGVTVGGSSTTAGDGTGNNTSNVGSPTLNALNASPTWQGYKASVAKLATYGVKVNPDGSFTTKDGKTYNAKDLMNGSGAAAAGISGSQMDGFTAAVNAEKKKLETQAKGTDSNADSYGDSVAGGGKSSASYGGGLGAGNNLAATGPRMGLDRNPAQVAGMSVNYGGEQIGVAADSLFDMVDRRYQLHKDKGSFLTPGL